MPDTAPPPLAHNWIAVTAPNGDQGFQCSRCKLTAIHLPVPKNCEQCPYIQPRIPTVGELLRSVRRHNAHA
jgi:hypothetical protein